MRINKKKTAALCILALCATCLTTGCKKKHEKISLENAPSSTAETMALGTSAAPTSQVYTEAFNIDPAVENAANANSSEKGTSGRDGAAVAANNVIATINTYASNSISIQYPSVEKLDDAQKQERINELLKKNALSVLTAFQVDETIDNIDIKCTVLSSDRSRITAIYKGSFFRKGSAHPVNLFYSNTIDVRKEENLGFSHFADPSSMAAYVRSENCVFPNANDALRTQLMKVKNEYSAEYYTGIFKGADFPFEGEFPSCFSYEHNGEIFFSIPVPHELGGYAIIAYTPETK